MKARGSSGSGAEAMPLHLSVARTRRQTMARLPIDFATGVCGTDGALAGVLSAGSAERPGRVISERTPQGVRAERPPHGRY